MHKRAAPNPKDDASDPAQIILITLAINYVEEVEQAFRDFHSDAPNAHAMIEYKDKQVCSQLFMYLLMNACMGIVRMYVFIFTLGLVRLFVWIESMRMHASL